MSLSTTDGLPRTIHSGSNSKEVTVVRFVLRVLLGRRVFLSLLVVGAVGSWLGLGGSAGARRLWNCLFHANDVFTLASRQTTEARVEALDQLLGEVKEPLADFNAALLRRHAELALLQEREQLVLRGGILQMDAGALEELRAKIQSSAAALARIVVLNERVATMTDRAERRRQEIMPAPAAVTNSSPTPAEGGATVTDPEAERILRLYEQLYMGLHAIDPTLVRELPAARGGNDRALN